MDGNTRDEQGTEEKQQQEEPKQDPQQDQQEEPKPKGRPDEEKASEKYRQQRDDARKERDELMAQVEKLKGESEEVKALQQRISEMQKQAEEAQRRADFERVNTRRLAEAGCVDIDVALTLLDENGDVESLKDKKPYLFAEKRGSTGIQPSGAAKEDDDAWLAKAMGVKKKG